MENLHPTEEVLAIRESMRARFAKLANTGLYEIAYQLGADGLFGAIVPESLNGLGLGFREATEIARMAGECLLPFPITGTFIAAELLALSLPDVALDVVSGRSIATLAWGEPLWATELEGRWHVRGAVSHVTAIRSSKILIARLRVESSSQEGFAVIDVDKDSVLPSGEAEMDLEVETTGAVVDTIVPTARVIFLNQAAVDEKVRRALVFHFAEMVGLASAAHESAKSYALTRNQFGRPIAAFQSVRHSLARDNVSLEGASLATTYATLASDTAGGPMACDCAGAVVPDYCLAVAESAMHLHGAMGFTFDMPQHRYVRRIRSLSAICDAFKSREAIARSLI